MGKIALVFPGQGAQAIGMGRHLFETYPIAKMVLEEIDDNLKANLACLMFDGPLDLLTMTSNAQPAILAVSMMAFKVLDQAIDNQLLDHIDYVAGHSLGEYSALCAVGSYSIGEAATLVKLRGNAMQRAAPVGTGSMAAILGLDLLLIEQICAHFQTPQNICVVANDNAPGQVVISGHHQAIESCIEKAKLKGAKRCVPLPVSSSFHSPLMESAAIIMNEALVSIPPHIPKKPIISNINASAVTDPSQIIELLTQQICGRVRWRESIEHLSALGCDTFIEIGPGKVLTNLIKRIVPGALILNIEEPKDIEPIVKILKR